MIKKIMVVGLIIALAQVATVSAMKRSRASVDGMRAEGKQEEKRQRDDARAVSAADVSHLEELLTPEQEARVLKELDGAMRAQDFDTVRTILTKHPLVNAIDECGQTYLFLASAAGDVPVVRLMLECKADTEIANDSGLTALVMAADRGHGQVVEVLLASRANIHGATPEKFTPLFQASVGGHEEVVQMLLEERADIEPRNVKNETPLMVVADHGRAAMVRLLLDNGADCNAVGGLYGGFVLHFAAGQDRVQVMGDLLRHGAFIEARTSEGATPLFLAAQNGHKSAVACLLDAKADPNALSHKHGGPLEGTVFSAELSEIEIEKQCSIGKMLVLAGARFPFADFSRAVTLCVSWPALHSAFMEARAERERLIVLDSVTPEVQGERAQLMNPAFMMARAVREVEIEKECWALKKSGVTARIEIRK